MLKFPVEIYGNQPIVQPLNFTTMTVIVITATIIGLALSSLRPTPSISGDQINVEALSLRAIGNGYSMVPIPSINSSAN